MKEEIYIRVMRIFFLRDLSTLRVVNIAIYIYIYIYIFYHYLFFLGKNVPSHIIWRINRTPIFHPLCNVVEIRLSLFQILFTTNKAKKKLISI